MATKNHFSKTPKTISNGGFKKGKYIIWVNLQVASIVGAMEDTDETYEAITERMVLPDNSIQAFLDNIDPEFLALATIEELTAILMYFNEFNNLESWKKILDVQVTGYDRTLTINHFQLNGKCYWLDKATRVGLVNSITVEKNAGRGRTTLWFDESPLSLNVDGALNILYKLELYALECYNVTAQHRADIKALRTTLEAAMYDVTANYPTPLEFNFSSLSS